MKTRERESVAGLYGHQAPKRRIVASDRAAICAKCPSRQRVKRGGRWCYRCAHGGCCEDLADRQKHGGCPAKKF